MCDRTIHGAYSSINYNIKLQLPAALQILLGAGEDEVVVPISPGLIKELQSVYRTQGGCHAL